MKWKIYLIIYSVFIFLIFIGAYLGLISTELKSIPFYDSIGHFALYGIWSYLFIKSFPNKIIVWKFVLSQGVLIISVIAILEEGLQMLSKARTFSLYDLGFGLLGILVANLLAKILK